MTALLIFGVLAGILIAIAWSRTQARKRAFSSLAQRTGLVEVDDGASVERLLAALPAMQTRGRIMIARALRTDDEVVADWRVVRHVKDPARHRRDERQQVRTCVALRRAGANYPSVREAREDVEPGGVGRVWIESGGEWLACHSRDGRVPNDALLAFRERARILLETPPAEAAR